MLTFEESREVLTQLADSLPQPIFNKLNGGIVLLPDTLTDRNGLLILGQYHVQPNGLGRYITIYYGSVVQAHGHLDPEAFQKKLEDVLRHELTHHLENLAGDHSLEIKDAQDIRRMLARRKKAR